MTAFIIWAVAFTRDHSRGMSLRAFSLILLLLVMMGSMFDSLAYYFATPRSFLTAVLALNISMVAMTLAIVYLLWLAFREKSNHWGRGSPIAFSLIVAWNEISMALFLWVLAYPSTVPLSAISIADFFGSAVSGIFFYVPMVAEMVFFIAFSKAHKIGRRASAGILVMQLADPALAGTSEISAYLVGAFSVLMVVALYILFSYIYTNRSRLEAGDREIATWFITIVVVSLAGLVEPLFITSPFGLSWLLFSISMIVAMVVYFRIVFDGTGKEASETGPSLIRSPV